MRKDLDRLPSEAPKDRIQFAREINDPTPAAVVYWAHPAQLSDVPLKMSREEYLGRDVAKGGYLVLQTDLARFQRLNFDPDQWDPVYRGPPNGSVLPSFHQPDPAGADFFQIFRRRR